MRFILFTIGILIPIISTAQIGINTDNPQQLIHIDPLRDTQVLPVVSNDLDDVVITEEGYIGLGTINPTARIDIKTAGTLTAPVIGFCLQDGSQSENYGLTSDKDGYAQWKKIVTSASVEAIRSSSGAIINLEDAKNRYYDTATTLTLPVGRWLINIVLLVPFSTSTYQIQFSFGDSDSINGATPLDTPDLEGTKFITGLAWNGCNGLVKNTLIINNQSDQEKIYNLLAGYSVSSDNSTIYGIGGAWAEDVIVAFQTQD